MRIRTITRKVGRAVAATVAVVAAVAAGAAVSPGSAQAQSCPYQHFCYYDYNNQHGDRATQYYYTSGWVTMGSLRNDSQSGWERQTGDARCAIGQPIIFLRDSGPSIVKQYPAFYGYQVDSFNTYNNWQRSNRFDQIWNTC